MKISYLVHKLEKLSEKNGNQEIYLNLGGMCYGIESVSFEMIHNGFEKDDKTPKTFPGIVLMPSDDGLF